MLDRMPACWSCTVFNSVSKFSWLVESCSSVPRPEFAQSAAALANFVARFSPSLRRVCKIVEVAANVASSPSETVPVRAGVAEANDLESSRSLRKLLPVASTVASFVCQHPSALASLPGALVAEAWVGRSVSVAELHAGLGLSNLHTAPALSWVNIVSSPPEVERYSLSPDPPSPAGGRSHTTSICWSLALFTWALYQTPSPVYSAQTCAPAVTASSKTLSSWVSLADVAEVSDTTLCDVALASWGSGVSSRAAATASCNEYASRTATSLGCISVAEMSCSTHWTSSVWGPGGPLEPKGLPRSDSSATSASRGSICRSSAGEAAEASERMASSKRPASGIAFSGAPPTLKLGSAAARSTKRPVAERESTLSNMYKAWLCSKALSAMFVSALAFPIRRDSHRCNILSSAPRLEDSNALASLAKERVRVPRSIESSEPADSIPLRGNMSICSETAPTTLSAEALKTALLCSARVCADTRSCSPYCCNSA
mmetsp:Transcript_41731/g.73367  ORF Transcript_41731/g.73367 Transcript_41731/m.73367 type:complete len:487 (-) Transcript_41731:418-1878(-)